MFIKINKLTPIYKFNYLYKSFLNICQYYLVITQKK